jgi:parallel beta-helix repeat protein
MNRKLVLALALTLLIGLLSVAFNLQPVKASGTIYIRADGSVDPSDAPISTVDNVTYTLTGNITSDAYAHGIVIERNNTIVDGAGCRLQGEGEVWEVTGISLQGNSNVTIKNMEITGFGDGISLAQASDNTFSGNKITNSMFGIRLSGCEHNNITGNNITENSWHGIFLDGSSHNVISENTFVNDGLSVYASYGNLVEDNIVNGKPLVFLEGESDLSVINAGQVLLVNCSGIRVENLNLSNADIGVELWGTHNSAVIGNNISGNGGIDAWGAVTLFDSSNNSIIQNNVTYNEWGVHVFGGSSNNNLSGNCIKANSERGIQCDAGSNNTIVGNNVTQNRYGIWISDSGNNIIAGNNISDNGYAGIALPYCLNNSIYHNNFVNNARQVYDDNLLTNIWDDGVSGGNYWSDYTGVDEKSGPNQDQPGSDGIGDTPYIIDYNNRDDYPLMEPWTPPEHELVVSITPLYFLKLGDFTSLDTSVANQGSNDEIDIEFSLLINDTIVNSTTILLLQPGNSYTLKYLWAPTVEGTYNITAYAHPVPGETYVGNNRVSEFVTVSATIVVPDSYPTIQAAITAANSGDTIFVKEGTYYEHIVVDKSITLIGEYRDRTIIDGSSNGTVINMTVSNVNVTGFTIQKSGPHPDCGIYVSSSFNNISYNIIKNCPAYYIGYAIELFNSSNTIVHGNFITANKMTAVLLYNSSHNILSENNITDNEYGIGLSGSDEYSSSDNTIFGNNITNNSETGISLYRSPSNIISQNNITNNKIGIGITDYPSSNTTICENDIANNTKGVSLISSGNKIYHNNFIGNTQQACLMLGANSQDVWDDDYTSGGNYWSDYTGTDANSDGIGDSPYIINDNNRDRYPLVNHWTPNWTPSNHVPPVTPNVQVGVKSGDWIKIDYTITGWPAGTPYPLWLKVEFLSVEGTNASVRVTMHMSDGTEQNATVPVDVVAGGQALGLSGFVIPANLTTGDIIFMSGYGNVTIEGETTRTYAGASRKVVYASFSQYGTQLTYYWDKLTGVMVEASTISGGITGTGKATETNMWQAAPSGLPIEPIYLYILAALVIIIAVGAAAFIVRRRKKPPEEAKSPQI